MWHGTIMLNRPFITLPHPNPNFNPAQNPTPLAICVEAANNICLVYDKYFDRLLGLPCDTVFSIFVAASVLLYHERNGPKGATDESRSRFRQYVSWLSQHDTS